MIFSCREDEIDLFHGKAALFIGVKMDRAEAPENDMDTVRSLSFGFTDRQEATINFMVRLQGIPVKEDRKIKIKVAGTATKGSDYELNENVVLPGGAHYVLIPCRIIRNASLLDTQKNIVLSLVTDELFLVPDTTTARINLSDGIPTDWVNNSMATYVLGTCRKVKYRFFYDMMGYYDLADILYGDLSNDAKYLNKKIEDYNLNPDKYEHKYGDVPLTFRFDPWD
jgi:hypothetical protein